VNFTGWSYAGEMTIAVMACRERVPDIWDLAAGLRTSLDELIAAIGDLPPRQPTG
jgi:diacylglycerol O-acyltransferase